MQFPLVSAWKVKKHGVREIVVSAPRGQPGNTDFEAMSTKNLFNKSLQIWEREKWACDYLDRFLISEQFLILNN
jgi:hypothetical protein